MKKKEKNIIAFVSQVPKTSIDAIRSYKTDNGMKYRIMVIRDSRRPVPEILLQEKSIFVVVCDFSKPWKIAEALVPYQDELVAISCRGEAQIADFRNIIPHVPYLRTPSTESLVWCTDKYEMRKRFKLHIPKHTPKFTRVLENSSKERKRIADKVGFPMVVKPASLSGSLLVSICYHEEDLEKALRTTFRKIKATYAGDRRQEEPKVIAEEYMEGLMYSIDSYVDSRGKIYHCPLVRTKTGRDIGVDDFFNYLQITPTALKKETIAKAEAVTEGAVHALGLRSTTTHTELMRIDDEWKLIEVGARMGGMRDILYSLSCDIDHALNDVLIRLPKKPVIPKKCKGFSAYLKYYAKKEGRILETRGVKKIEELESFQSIVVNKKVGDRAVFAKNAGRSVFNAVLYNKDRSKLLADIRRIEQMVEIKVGNGRTKSKDTVKKSSTKKAVLKKVAPAKKTEAKVKKK